MHVPFSEELSLIIFDISGPFLALAGLLSICFALLLLIVARLVLKRALNAPIRYEIEFYDTHISLPGERWQHVKDVPSFFSCPVCGQSASAPLTIYRLNKSSYLIGVVVHRCSQIEKYNFSTCDTQATPAI